MKDTKDILKDNSQVKIMAILNYTADSFYDGGKYNTPEKFFQRAEQCVKEGADILDIGVASSRPGAPLIEPQKEWGLIQPLLTAVRKQFPETLISIDTYNAFTAEKCIELGADIINDISGGQFDKKMFDVISDHPSIFYVLMHTSDIPERMQQKTNYQNIVNDIQQYFAERIKALENRGFYNIIIDPGFGFGKTMEQNYELLERLEEFQIFNKPLLAGLSRKSMIYKKLNSTADSYETLIGTIILNTKAVMKGVRILRVHDVKENVILKTIY
ncbi:MAG: dihydropteroate synthase [Bacteroidia bacterium]|nr:dihydropteroate synthase [Bacteroidia bacterium]